MGHAALLGWHSSHVGTGCGCKLAVKPCSGTGILPLYIYNINNFNANPCCSSPWSPVPQPRGSTRSTHNSSSRPRVRRGMVPRGPSPRGRSSHRGEYRAAAYVCNAPGRSGLHWTGKGRGFRECTVSGTGLDAFRALNDWVQRVSAATACNQPAAHQTALALPADHPNP